MQYSKREPVKLSISEMALGGRGIAKTEEGYVIFVEGAIPGDSGEVMLTKIKKQYAEGRMIRRHKDSEKRIAPRCKHFGTCGGCTWQFLKYEDQIRIKEQHVRDALERIGDLTNPPVLPIWESPNQWFYRNKMEYSFFDRPVASPENPQIILGLHAGGKYDEGFDLEECYLQSAFSVSVVKWVKQWVQEKKLTAYNPRQKTGFLRNLVIREARSTGEFLINLLTSKEFPELWKTMLEEFTQKILNAFPKITSLFHTTVDIKTGKRTAMSEILLAGKPMLTEIVVIERQNKEPIRLIFDIAPQAFFQPNTKAAELLLRALFELGRPTTDDIVFDLYCGTGIMGMFFAKVAKKVYGIELNASAIESAKQNVEKNGIANIEFFCGDVAKMIEKIHEKSSMMVIDPPRAGLTPKTIELLQNLSPQKLLYVSCNPATLARDLKILTETFRLEKVQPIDLFPHTYHMETVCFLTRKSS